MSFVNSPSMLLPIPTVGTEPDPLYALDVNNCMTTIDSHDHSLNKGVQINPAGININTALTFADNLATNLQGANFFLQAGAVTTPLTLYVTNGAESPTPLPDLWYYDGTNQVQLTAGGLVNATIASIPGESYAGGTFTWRQGTGSTTPANFDIGSVTIRPNTAGTANGVTVSPPSGIASAYTINLPALPAGASTLHMTSSGVSTADIPNVIVSSSCGAFHSNGTGTPQTVTNLSCTITTLGRPVMLMLQPANSTAVCAITISVSSSGPTLVTYLRGGSTITQFAIAKTSDAAPWSHAINLQYFDVVGAGTYTYTVQLAALSTNVLMNNYVLVAYEL